MTDDTDTSDYVAENSDASQPPSSLEERDAREATDWHCAQCGTEVDDAHDLANHECPPEED